MVRNQLVLTYFPRWPLWEIAIYTICVKYVHKCRLANMLLLTYTPGRTLSKTLNLAWPKYVPIRTKIFSFLYTFPFKQHMGENVLALIRHLTSSDSPIPSLTTGYTAPTTVFFSHIFRSFFTYSYTTAKVMYTALFVSSFLLVWVTFVDPAPALKKSGFVFWREQIKGCFAVIAGMLGTLLIPNVTAFVMRDVLDKAMSWFTSPLAAIAFYGPTALLGMSIISLCSDLID